MVAYVKLGWYSTVYKLPLRIQQHTLIPELTSAHLATSIQRVHDTTYFRLWKCEWCVGKCRCIDRGWKGTLPIHNKMVGQK